MSADDSSAWLSTDRPTPTLIRSKSVFAMTTPKTAFSLLATVALLTGPVQAAAIISGSGANDSLGNAETWGGSNFTTSSIIVDLRFDFTTTADNALDPDDDFWLWEFGAGVGSSLVLNGDNLQLASDGGASGGSHFTSGAHGLSGGMINVQVVSVMDFENNLLSIYVNGSLIAQDTTYDVGDWSGTDASVLAPTGGGGGDQPDEGNIDAYPSAASANFTLDVYLLGDGSGNTHTLESILIPEPSSALLCVLSSMFLLRRRRS